MGGGARRRERTKNCLRWDEDGGAVGVVKVLCALACELDMLFLVIADGDVCRPVLRN